MIERHWDANLPIQANFYPISSTVSMPGPTTQMTVLSRQGVGVGSVAEDALQVMLDRRTMQDDGRGMGEKVTDNAKLEERFFLLFQDVSDGRSERLFPRTSTPLLRRLQARLEYPVEALFAPLGQWAAGGCSVAPLALVAGAALQEDVEVFSFQPTSSEANLAVLRLSHFAQGGPPGPVAAVDLQRFLGPSARIKGAKEVTLASMHVLDAAVDTANVVVPRMAMRSFLLELAPSSSAFVRRELSPGTPQAAPPVQLPSPAPLPVPAPNLLPPLQQQKPGHQQQQQQQATELRQQLQEREQAEEELRARIEMQQLLQGAKEGEMLERQQRQQRRQWDVPGQQHEPVQLQPLPGFAPRALQPAPPRLVVRPVERVHAPVWTYVLIFLFVIFVATAWMCKLLCCGTPRPSRFSRTKSRREVV